MYIFYSLVPIRRLGSLPRFLLYSCCTSIRTGVSRIPITVAADVTLPESRREQAKKPKGLLSKLAGIQGIVHFCTDERDKGKGIAV
jgi:hypothetical protein